ncbi:restriction endonuclease subunit S [uncultured Chryseobacterium sp.]|uniref:restriction endonuclease subunit S n=1 Tax=uncultured Chryseobacterium sp. TaxID=259322 RepID=UPI0025E2897D|nr:restriction endonuclease subunit S [uncultured Chryseobacterium sp.]
MSKWNKISIGEFIDFNPSESIKKGTIARKIPMDKLGTFQRKINGSELSEYSSGPKFRNGDTLVAKITPCLENGKTALVDILSDKEVAFGSSEFIVLRENKNSYKKFIYYLSRSPLFRNKAISCMEGTSGRKRVNEGALKTQEILVPDLPTQQKIASVLSALDDKIELNNLINAELEAMAKTLYDYWFVQFDFPVSGTLASTPLSQQSVAESSRGYKSSGGKMVYNETLKREIPEGWEVKNLFEVCNVQYGFPFSTEYFNEVGNGIPVIRIRDIIENSVSNYSTEKNIDSKYEILKGDLLIGMDGNFHINYWTKNNCYLNQRVVKLTEKELPNIFLRYQIEPYIKAREASVSRTTVGHLSDKDLKAINILVPPKEIKLKIKNIYSNTLNKIITNKEQNQELSALRDWLLPMLMNGQVKVGEAEKQVLGMVAKSDTSYNRSSQKNDDELFEVWLKEEKLAARGDIDRATLRELFDAMDDEDKY